MKNILKKIVLPALLISSCGPRERVSKEVFEAVNNKMEVKKLSDFEIVQEAIVWGDSIATEAQVQLMTNLQKAIAEEGVAGAVEYCQVNAIPILAEVSDKYGVAIRRVSNRYRNPADRPTAVELSLLEAYEYNAENGIESEPNIQKTENGEVLLYTKAIKIEREFCLNCHGDPAKNIEAATLEKINTLYPNDQAKGHQMGDLRGMWVIRIPTKEIVNRL